MALSSNGFYHVRLTAEILHTSPLKISIIMDNLDVVDFQYNGPLRTTTSIPYPDSLTAEVLYL